MGKDARDHSVVQHALRDTPAFHGGTLGVRVGLSASPGESGNKVLPMPHTMQCSEGREADNNLCPKSERAWQRSHGARPRSHPDSLTHHDSVMQVLLRGSRLLIPS